MTFQILAAGGTSLLAQASQQAKPKKATKTSPPPSPPPSSPPPPPSALPRPRPVSKSKKQVTPRGALIKSIVIKGLRRLRPVQARRWIFSQEQEKFSKETLRKDLRRLRRTGYFSRVDARVQFKNGWATVIFTLTERVGRVRAVSFVGSRNYTQAQLYSLIQLRPGMPFNRDLLTKDARRIVKIYHNIGYFRVRVTVQGRWIGQTLMLWFVIKENEPALIRHVLLRGNRKVSSKRLLPLLDSRAYSLSAGFSQKGFFHPSFVARDVYFLKNYYFDHGFIDIKVTGPKIWVSRDKRYATLVYRIREGNVYRYGDIRVYGDLIAPRKSIRKKLRIRSGQVFNRTELYSRNIVPLLRYYRDNGYAYARVQTIPQTDSTKRLVHLQFQIAKGPLVRIERIEIVGNRETRDRVIRRQIRLKEGDLYSETKLIQSRFGILGTGFFARTDPQRGIKIEVRRGSRPDRVILRFYVKEKSTWIYNFGFSYINPFGFVFTGRLGKTNFLGHGQTLMGTGAISTTLRLWQVALTFFDPYLFDTNLSLFFSGFVTHRDSSSSISPGFLLDSVGASMSLSHPLGVRTLRLNLTYRVANFNLTPAGKQEFNVPVSGYFTRSLSSSLRLRISWDTRNTAVDTSKGFQLYASYEHAARYLGSDYTLHRWEAGARFYFRLPLNSTFKFALTSGWSISPDANGVPPFERYPLDGSYFLLRGFEPNSIGPTRAIPGVGEPSFQRSGIIWGGTKKFVFNAEWILPLWKALRLSGVLFFDAGNVFDDHEWPFQDLRNRSLPLGLYMNLGFGFRWTLPGVGVARFEFGVPLTRRASDGAVFFNFLVGESF